MLFFFNLQKIRTFLFNALNYPEVKSLINI